MATNLSQSTGDNRILVLAEKPDAARKIAQALSKEGRIPYGDHGVIDLPDSYDGHHYLICSAVGHLYELVDSHQRRDLFPVMDIEWSSRGSQSARRFGKTSYSSMGKITRDRIAQIARAAVQCSKLINACDYDTEGETIGFNSLVFAFSHMNKRPEILRAKFSTLTVEEIRDSFRKLKSSDLSFASAGRMRHLADFLWGVNLSRALTIDSNYGKTHGSFRNITIGRVQGPTLAFIVDRELARLSHVPIPSWTITCDLMKSGIKIITRFANSPIKKQSVALDIHRAVSVAKEAIVKRVGKDILSIPPRYPFDLGELQRESYRLFKQSPKATLSIAQKLYQDALISYPRTDSQKLPERIGIANIFKKLSSFGKYSSLVSQLLSDPKTRTRPREGPQEDSAHPAIFPTGEHPKVELTLIEAKVYDLIVRRFCNAFASNEIVENLRIVFDINLYDFVSSGSVVLEKGWSAYYPFGKNFESSLNVPIVEGEKVPVVSVSIAESYNPQPSRFTEGSLLAQMESEKIGTKATRAETISTLLNREYVHKDRLELLPTGLGTSLVENARVLSPEIVTTGMTRALEERLEKIRSGAESDVEFVAQMVSDFRTVMANMLDKTIEIESENVARTQPRVRPNVQLRSELGSCPSCKTGKLELIRSPKTKKRFIRCSNSAKGCKASSPALPLGQIMPVGERCNQCSWPLVNVSRFNRMSLAKTCSNFSCSSRAVQND